MAGLLVALAVAVLGTHLPIQAAYHPFVPDLARASDGDENVWPDTNSDTNWLRSHATAGEPTSDSDLRTDGRRQYATPKFESPLPHDSAPT